MQKQNWGPCSLGRLTEIIERKRGDSQCFLKSIRGQLKRCSSRWTSSKMSPQPAWWEQRSPDTDCYSWHCHFSQSMSQHLLAPWPCMPLLLTTKWILSCPHSSYYSVGCVWLIVHGQVTCLCPRCKGNRETENAALFLWGGGGARFCKTPQSGSFAS